MDAGTEDTKLMEGQNNKQNFVWTDGTLMLPVVMSLVFTMIVCVPFWADNRRAVWVKDALLPMMVTWFGWGWFIAILSLNAIVSALLSILAIKRMGYRWRVVDSLIFGLFGSYLLPLIAGLVVICGGCMLAFGGMIWLVSLSRPTTARLEAWVNQEPIRATEEKDILLRPVEK